jgi:hypothetical protein
MRHKKIIFSIWESVAHFLKLSGEPTSHSAASNLSGTSLMAEDDLNYPFLPGPDEISVVEIDQVEFVQEWGRTVANETFTHATRSGEGVLGVDRRVLDDDRRHPNHDRRMGDGHDRRGHSTGADPVTGVDWRLPGYDRRRPHHDRRADNGHDRRDNSSSVGNSTRIDRRLLNYDRRNPNHDRRAGNSHDRRELTMSTGNAATSSKDPGKIN